MSGSVVGDLVARFQALVEGVPAAVQPLVVALAGAIPFLEGELSSILGVVGGLHPGVAALAGATGNFLCVLGVVLVTARVRTAVASRIGRGSESDEAPKPLSKGRQRFTRFLDRYGVPGASLLGPLALPTQFTSATLVASGVAVPRVLLWQGVAIALWTTITTLSTTGALALLGA